VKRFSNTIYLAVPSLLAIVIAQLVNMQAYNSWPIDRGDMLFTWMTLQIIPGFLSAYLSDFYLRKATLIICQVLGLLSVSLLAFFGAQFWVLLVTALIFNPVHVARAAFLDHFPKHSTVVLVAITFLAQVAPWVFYYSFATLSVTQSINVLGGLLIVNIVCIALFFKKGTPHSTHKEALSFIKDSPHRNILIKMFTAFVFAETAFYLVWSYLDSTHTESTKIAVTSMSTTVGIGIAMLYTRLPHISIITLLYGIGVGMTIIGLFQSLFIDAQYAQHLLSSVINYAVVGGLYLPFVTDAVIKQFGARKRAFGSASIALCDTVAIVVSAVLGTVFHQSAENVLITMMVCLGVATIFQRWAEMKNSCCQP
jgi:MFS family permease